MATALPLGLLLALAGSLAIYLASPNQRWLARPLMGRPARVAGFILLALGLLSLRQSLQATPAVFVLVTWAMLLFVLWPYLGALRPAPDKADRKKAR